VIDGHIQLVSVGVLDRHVLVFAERIADRAHLQETADAMIAVHDHLPGCELHDEGGVSSISRGGPASATRGGGLGTPRTARQR